MTLPNYKNNSIVNLVSSIEKACGGKPKYDQLKLLDTKRLQNSKNIVIILLDGLGYEHLKKNGKGSVLQKYLIGKITSVFPSATACAVTTFATGVAPQQHAITGWVTYLKELGEVTVILPFITRGGQLNINPKMIHPPLLFNQQSIAQRMKRKSYFVIARNIAYSTYSKNVHKKFQPLCYNSITGFFNQIKKAIRKRNKKYIYAYWPYFDNCCHKYGTESKEAKKHFGILNKELSSFINAIKGTNTTVIITADHGLMNTTKEKVVKLNNYPSIYNCLTLPLCGEARVAYCYVKPSKARLFEKMVKQRLGKMCRLHKSEELVKKGYFGLFKPDSKFLDRIGDYVIIPKEGYIIQDCILGEEEGYFIGNHGGLSKEEMLVPLIVIDTGKKTKA